MKLRNLLVLIGAAVANISLVIPAVVTTVNGLNAQNAPSIEEDEDITGVTAVKILKQPTKTVYQEGEYFDPEGLMCLITQNGIKKIVKKNFEVVDSHPLRIGETAARVKYGDFEFDVGIKILNFISVLNINHNGTYTIEAEDERIPIDGYIEADSAWSAAHYDGVNPVTKFVETWTNSRCSPSSGKSLANIAVGSVLGFKFTVSKACSITISANMAMYDTMRPSELLEFRLDGEVKDDVDKTLVLTHLDAEDNGAKYFNWQNWSMGTYDVEAGNHSFTLTVVSFKLPNLDSFKIVAKNMEGGDLINVDGNGTQTLLATDSSIDRTNWIKDSENFDFVENWTTDGATYLTQTSGQSIGHLSSGSQISLSLGLKGRARINFKPIIAHTESGKAYTYLEVTIDGTKLNQKDFGQDVDLTLGSSSVSNYWNWKGWNAGTIDLTKGSHVLVIKILKGCNLYGFEVTASNFANNEYGVATIKGNGNISLEAESGLIDRSTWSVREDFIQAGREPVEDWTNSGATVLSQTSGRSLCALNAGCEITLPFESNGNATLSFHIICAYVDAVKANTLLSVKLDGVDMDDVDSSLSLGSSSVSTYWNWKDFRGGRNQIERGQHVITVKIIGSVNVDSFVFETTNYSA